MIPGHQRIMVLLLACALSSQAVADDVSDFFTNRQMRLVSGSAVSESTSIYERLLARFLPKYLPGNPTIVAESMPGAGGLTAWKAPALNRSSSTIWARCTN
jgi:tripartite-type tricarboxylate transporter receptor subunit TctC